MNEPNSKVSIPQEELDRARQKLEERIKLESRGFDKLMAFMKAMDAENKNSR